MHLRYLWLIVLMIGATCPVWAASTWHVATTGSGSSCTAVAPCNQVSTGVSKMTTSDTLIIHAGTYGGSTAGNLKPPSGVSGAFTTIKNQPGEVVRLRPNSIGIDCILCLDLGRHHIKLDGLILDGGDTSGSLTNKSTWLSAFPILDNNQHTLDSVADITITNSEILRGRHSGFLVAGIRWTITNNDVHHNGTEGLQSPTPDHGLYYSARNGTLDNNLIRDNDCYGIQNYSSVGLNVSGNVHTRNTYFGNGCGGITIENNNSGVFANNVVYNNAATGATQAVLAGGNNGKIFYNTIVDNTGTTGIASQGGSPTSGLEMRNNIVCGNGSNIGSMGSAVLSNNVTTCPSFVNRGGRDFHLTAASTAPCLSGFTTDKDLVTRPQPAGGSCDVGAYEFPATVTPPPTPITVFVDTANLGGTGNDSTPCDSAGITTPRKTIAGGLACMTIPNSTLNIRAGTYNENIDTQATPIAGGTDAANMMTIQAYQAEVVTLSLPAGLHSVVDLRNNDAWVKIKNLRLDGNNISNSLVFFDGTHDSIAEGVEAFDAQFEVVFIRSANNNKVINSKIHTNTSTLALVGIDGTTSGTILDKNEIYDSPNPAIQERASTVIGTQVTRNLIHDVAPGAGKSAVLMQGDNPQLINNVIYGGANGIQLQGTVASAVLYHNTIYGRSGNAIQIDSGAASTIATNNLLYNNGAAIVGTATTQTNRTDNPNFLDPAAGNFHIPSNSTAKGSGTTIATVTVDADGTARTVPYDVGAYVFTPGTSGPITVFVDTNNLGGTANDSTPCASAGITTPRKTIAGGLACLTVGGSTLYIRAGLYAENIDTGVTAIASGSASDQTVISAYGAEDVTLSLPAGKTVVVHLRNNDAYILFDRLILRGNTLGQGLVFAAGSNNNVFQNGEIVNTLAEVVLSSGNANQVVRSLLHTSSGSGAAPLVGIAGSANGFVLDQNEIFDGPQAGVLEATSTVVNSVITRNKLHDVGVPNTKPAISVQGNSPDVINNIVYGGQVGIQVAAASRAASIFHNTVYGRPASGIQVDSGAQSTALTNNIAFNNTPNITNNAGAQTTQTTNVTTNPSFVDANNGNFHIPSGSTAAGTGTTLAAVTVDADGMARTAPYDVGAYVYTPSLAPVKPGPPWRKSYFFR